MKNLSAAFLEFVNSVKAKFDKSLKIHRNGVDNNYPDLIETLIDNSVTASRCANLMAAYLSGKGFGDELNKTIINKNKGTTLLQFTQDIADSISKHYGVFIHVNYDMNYDRTTLEVLPYRDCRIGKKDNNDYNGKILVCTDWNDKKLAKNAKHVDVFNPKKSVIQSQIDDAKSIDKYNGQILFFKFGNKIYPQSLIHPCIEDCESEKLSAVYKNTSLKKGFFGKTLVITKPLVDTTLQETHPEDYSSQLDERKAFRETIQKFIGAENSDGVLHLEMEFNGDDIEKEVYFKNIESNIDDKLFAFTEGSVSENICVAFGVPPLLIRPKDGALFSASGEMIKSMKAFYQDQTNDERMMVESLVNMLMSKFHKPKSNLKIQPLFESVETKENKDPDEARKQAQATLKGSVGGVTALLQIQQSVAAKTTDRSAAIAIIEEIYGIDKAKASEMLGTPKEE